MLMCCPLQNNHHRCSLHQSENIHPLPQIRHPHRDNQLLKKHNNAEDKQTLSDSHIVRSTKKTKSSSVTSQKFIDQICALVKSLYNLTDYQSPFSLHNLIRFISLCTKLSENARLAAERFLSYCLRNVMPLTKTSHLKEKLLASCRQYLFI